MSPRRTFNLLLELNEYNLSLFPDAMGKEKSDFYDAVKDRVRKAFDHLNGVLKQITIGESHLEIVWQGNSDRQTPIATVAEMLTTGNYADGILLLELFLSDNPDDGTLLYNLGMAYSDRSNLERAIALLTRLVEIDPEHINGRVALGVALLRNKNNDDGIRQLEIAVDQDPENLWAHRNLGASLMRMNRFSDAEKHLHLATEIAPGDQGSWYGYGQALEAQEKFKGADEAYLKAIEIDEFSEIAELARKGRSSLAQKSFRSVTPYIERMDAVMYCLGALEKFADMSPAEIQKIGFEIAILGTKGIDVNNPSKQYTLRSLPGTFTGLHLLSLQYVAFKQIMPEQDIGFDLSAEYRMALSLFEEKSGKKS
jgi:tetratricopeptide (TPR) repeat protein